MGSRFESFKKTESSDNEIDHFDEYGLYINYNDSNRLSAVEVTPASDIIYNGVSFFLLTTQKLFESICTFDTNAFRNRTGFIAVGIGVSCYAGSFRKNPDNPIESIVAFEKGYYDSMLEGLLKQRW